MINQKDSICNSLINIKYGLIFVSILHNSLCKNEKIQSNTPTNASLRQWLGRLAQWHLDSQRGPRDFCMDKQCWQQRPAIQKHLLHPHPEQDQALHQLKKSPKNIFGRSSVISIHVCVSVCIFIEEGIVLDRRIIQIYYKI